MEPYRTNPNTPRSAFIINLAPTGITGGAINSPHLPIDHQRIVEDIAACLELGVQMVHLHARDKDEKHCSDPEPYGRLIESIRGLPGGREAAVVVSTSGRCDSSFEARSLVLALDGDMKPDMASLTLSSLNFLHDTSVNRPETIRALAARMQERGIKPELEIFDLGMLNFAKVLIREGLIPDSVYANLLLGNIAGAQAQLLHAGSLLAEIPGHWVVAIAGIGRAQLTANTLGLLYADGVRIGLEDNLWYDRERTVHAQNTQLVERVLRLANELERPFADRKAVRRRLELAD